MDVTEIRRLNLRALAGSAGGITAFANKLGKAQPQISHLIGANPIKNVGNKLAREIEQLHNLPHGWVDQSHPELWVQHGFIIHHIKKDTLSSSVASGTPGSAPELTPKQAIFISYFEALTEEQQEELLRELEKTKQRNEAIFEVLSRKKAEK